MPLYGFMLNIGWRAEGRKSLDVLHQIKPWRSNIEDQTYLHKIEIDGVLIFIFFFFIFQFFLNRYPITLRSCRSRPWGIKNHPHLHLCTTQVLISKPSLFISSTSSFATYASPNPKKTTTFPLVGFSRNVHYNFSGRQNPTATFLQNYSFTQWSHGGKWVYAWN